MIGITLSSMVGYTLLNGIPHHILHAVTYMYIYNLQILTVKAQPTVLWILKGNDNWYGQWIRRCSNAWVAQLVWKAHLCSARESSQETGLKQFPDHETSATWLFVGVEMSWQMAPGGHWTVHLEAHLGSARKDWAHQNTLRAAVENGHIRHWDHCWQFLKIRD